MKITHSSNVFLMNVVIFSTKIFMFILNITIFVHM